MKILYPDNIPYTNAHNNIARKALIKVGDSKTKLQTINDAYLEPGQSFNSHIHDDCEEIYYFLDGKGIMNIGGINHEVNSGICILVEAKESHGLVNTASRRLRFITVRILL